MDACRIKDTGLCVAGQEKEVKQVWLKISEMFLEKLD
jgi:hypothetical protein